MEDLNIEAVELSTVIVSEEVKSERRQLRKRSGSDDMLHRTQNKVIKKKKGTPSEFKNEKDMQKYYLNINKNIKVKPILLETIFEDEETEESESVQVLGKASKRSLAMTNGYNVSKALTNKRKNQVKRKFGSRKKPKKMALKKFMEDFKKMTHEGEQ